jgi:hypothetical protein
MGLFRFKRENHMEHIDSARISHGWHEPAITAQRRVLARADKRQPPRRGLSRASQPVIRVSLRKADCPEKEF